MSSDTGDEIVTSQTNQSNYKTAKDTNMQISPLDNNDDRTINSILNSKSLDNSLKKYSKFIEQNKYRMPNFTSIEEAENAIRQLTQSLKQPQFKAQTQAKKNELGEKINQLKEQHHSIEEEQKRIQKFRSTSVTASQKEDEEYKEIKAKIAAAKGQLADAQFTKTNDDAELKRAQSEYELAVKKNQALQTQRDKLTEDQRILSLLDNQLKLDMRVLNEQNQQCEKDETQLAKLEASNLEKQGQLSALEQQHQQLQGQIKTLKDEIQKYMRIAEEQSNKYDELLNNAKFSKKINELERNSSGSPSKQYSSSTLSTPTKSALMSGSPTKDWNKSSSPSYLYSTPNRSLGTPEKSAYSSSRTFESPLKSFDSPPRESPTIFDDSPARSALKKDPTPRPNPNRVRFDQPKDSDSLVSDDDLLNSDSLDDDFGVPHPSLTDDLIADAMRAISQNIADSDSVMSRH